MVTIWCAMDTQFSDLEILAPKIEMVRTASRWQFASHLTVVEPGIYLSAASWEMKLPFDLTHIEWKKCRPN